MLHAFAAGTWNIYEQQVQFVAHARRHHFEYVPGRLEEHRKRLHLTLLETAQRILSAFPEAISASATAQLCALGVDVRTGVRVVAADAEGYTLAGCERVQAALKVWAAGIKASGSFDESRLDSIARARWWSALTCWP